MNRDSRFPASSVPMVMVPITSLGALSGYNAAQPRQKRAKFAPTKHLANISHDGQTFVWVNEKEPILGPDGVKRPAREYGLARKNGIVYFKLGEVTHLCANRTGQSLFPTGDKTVSLAEIRDGDWRVRLPNGGYALSSEILAPKAGKKKAAKKIVKKPADAPAVPATK